MHIGSTDQFGKVCVMGSFLMATMGPFNLIGNFSLEEQWAHSMS